MRFQKVTLPGGNQIVDTNLPQRGIKPAGLNLQIDLVRSLVAALGDAANMENGVVRSLGKAVVSMIFDIEKRDTAIENAARIIDEEFAAQGGADHLDYASRVRLESEIWYDLALREMGEHMDGAFGISHRIAIGISGAYDPEDYTQEEEIEAGGADLHEEWIDTEAKDAE